MANYADNAVGDLQDLFRRAKSARSPFEPDMFLNLSFYAGSSSNMGQWLNWAGNRLNRPMIDPRRQLVTDNRVMPIVTHCSSRKVKNKPVFTVTPFSNDDADVEASNIANKVLEGDWDYLDLQQKLFDAVLWSDGVCDGFWKIYWDSTIGESDDFLIGPDGRPLLNPEDNTPLRASEAEKVPPEVLQNVTVKTLAPGDVCVEVITPFELFPDPLASSMEDLEWMIEEKIRSENYIKQRYPTDANGNEFNPTPDADVQGGIAESRLGGPALTSSGVDYKGVKLYEYWCKPNVEHPKGKRCVWANDTVLIEEEPFDPMPYVRFSSVTVPGRFWSQGLTTFLRGPQEQLNKIRTQILENAKRLGNPALMSSRQANVEYSGDAGEHIKFDSTVPDSVPTFLHPPDIPSYVENEIQRIEESMNEISGIHEVSKAQVPTGVTAASAINLLQEQDDTRLGPQIQAMERALEQAGTKIVKLRAKFNTDERTIRLVGEDGDWDIFAFKGAMLGDEPQVEVQAGSAMPRSKAAKQAAGFQLLEMWLQYGQPLDSRSARKFFKDLEVGSIDRLFENISNDEAQTVREHRMLYNGEEVQITPVDNDQFHIEAHEDECKTSRFAGQPVPIKQNFYNHIALHRMRLKQIADMQAAAQQGPQDTPKESIAYKDAPPDIQRQMEQQAGMEPSTTGVTVDQMSQAVQHDNQQKQQPQQNGGNGASGKPQAASPSARSSEKG